MKTLLIAGLLGAGLAWAPGMALADTLSDLYDDALAEAAAGNPLLESADWQFRDGNVQQGCSLMEQARVHYEKAYMDMQAMDQTVNDPANGYSDEDRQKVMDWIAEQKGILDPTAAEMSETYFSTCQG